MPFVLLLKVNRTWDVWWEVLLGLNLTLRWRFDASQWINLTEGCKTGDEILWKTELRSIFLLILQTNIQQDKKFKLKYLQSFKSEIFAMKNVYFLHGLEAGENLPPASTHIQYIYDTFRYDFKKLFLYLLYLNVMSRKKYGFISKWYQVVAFWKIWFRNESRFFLPSQLSKQLRSANFGRSGLIYPTQ